MAAQVRNAVARRGPAGAPAGWRNAGAPNDLHALEPNRRLVAGTQPIDRRGGADAWLVRVVPVFGTAQAHHGYLFANARASRIKLLVHDGVGGVWGAALRLNAGRFKWPRGVLQGSALMTLTQLPFGARELGLP